MVVTDLIKLGEKQYCMLMVARLYPRLVPTNNQDISV